MIDNVPNSRYHIAVLGANGGIGKRVVLKALDEGHHVTAILRTTAKLNIRHANLTVVQGDVNEPECLIKELKGLHSVISAIGKNSFKKTTLYSKGNGNVLWAMNEAGINRVFFISAAGLDINPTHSPLVKFVTRLILQPLLRNMYADLREMERVVKESGVDYTIVRPPRLTNNPETGKYRIEIDHPLANGKKISRADVAHFIVSNLVNESIYKATVEIGY